MTNYREKICTNIPYTPDEEWLLKHLKCDRDSFVFRRSLELFKQTQASFKPAYLIREYPIERLDDFGMTIGGCEFNSRIAARRLKGANMVFVYIATCGAELSRVLAGIRDIIDYYLLDQLAYNAYLCAMSALAADMEPNFDVARYRILCPGAVSDWSVVEVLKFFTLLDGLHQPLNLHVLDSGLIEPLKSSSGILYATDEEYESCALCLHPNCAERRADFDRDL